MRRGFFNEPKFVAIYLTRALTGLTLADIGLVYGVKKYGTVSANVKRVEKELNGNKNLRIKVEKIKSEILKPQIET